MASHPVSGLPFSALNLMIRRNQYMAENEILNSTAVDASNEYDASEIQVLEGPL